jgi:hypothetical protein
VIGWSSAAAGASALNGDARTTTRLSDTPAP